MNNTREFEIRDEALDLTVAAYQLLSDLPATTDRATRSQFIDDSFLVSSLIAQAFRSSQTETSEQDIVVSLDKLAEMLATTRAWEPLSKSATSSFRRFARLVKQLQGDLTELLASINQLKAETFSTKLETTCF